MMNEHDGQGKWWFLSGSLETVATALRNLADVTSSTRNLLLCCFQCGRDTIGCFKRRETSPDGAWFDCEQFQTDHPYCYENPIAIPHNDDVILSPPNQVRDVNHVSRKCNGIFATTSPPLPQEKIPASILNVVTKEEKKCVLSVTEETNIDISLVEQSEPQKLTKYLKYKQSLMASTSFASKLEQDHFGQRTDTLRSEGEVLNLNFQRSKSERNYNRPCIKSPVLESRKLHFQRLDLDVQKSEDEESITSLDEIICSLSMEQIWQPKELEEAFQVYNASTLQSYGYMNSMQPKKPSSSLKGGGEKFVDVFPPLLNKSEKTQSLEQNNNDKCFAKIQPPLESTLHEYISDKQTSLVIPLTKKENETLTENDCDNALTIAELKKLIHTCMTAKSVTELNLTLSHFRNKDSICDKIFTYCGKSFNSTLLFNLVKEAKMDYLNQYSYSLIYTLGCPISIIESKVIDSIEFGKKCKPYQMALLEDIEKFRQRIIMYSNLSEIAKVPDEILIENVTAEEIRKEGRQWQNVKLEEKEIRNNISQEIFHDLLNSEISCLKSVISRKISDLL